MKYIIYVTLNVLDTRIFPAAQYSTHYLANSAKLAHNVTNPTIFDNMANEITWHTSGLPDTYLGNLSISDDA